jgi:hypothetical protein
MTCQNTGPLHLGISKEACENAGGQWFRRPCVTLKDAIDERPSRFELDVPRSGSCGDALRLLDVAYLKVDLTIYDPKFMFERNATGCNKFCRRYDFCVCVDACFYSLLNLLPAIVAFPIIRVKLP